MQGKNIVLIGGSYGIGASLADMISTAGANLWVLSRSKASAGRHIAFNAVTDRIDQTVLPDIIHGLAYLPGSIQLKPISRLTDEELLHDLNINALCAARCIRDVLPLLKKAEQASIVLFSTVAAQQGMPFHSSVAMAKGAVEGLTRALAAELAPRIRVNAVAPSLTDTPLAAKFLSTADRKMASAKRHPLMRIGTAGDVAHAAFYLLSDASSWITGQVLHVDGGLSAVRL
ncbi:MAG: oxidoreductase [Cyclobacteriaceae bacterium]|nr:MAG: oxidoreductase [Cyclobacteriaceae bacterium]